jgi:hypothetical protein
LFFLVKVRGFQEIDSVAIIDIWLFEHIPHIDIDDNSRAVARYERQVTAGDRLSLWTGDSRHARIRDYYFSVPLTPGNLFNSIVWANR